jgi:hypothetical protein
MLSLQRSAGNQAVASLISGSSGQPLDAATREEMEERFGEDFTDVRVHANGSSTVATAALGADAWTAGRDVVFGAGLYSPHTSGGKRLLAHELAHVVQQRRSGNAPNAFDRNSEIELDAARAASQFSAGTGRVSVNAASGQGVARQEADDEPWWKKTLNPLYQRALEVLPKEAAEKLEEVNEIAKTVIKETGVSDETLNTVVEAAEPVIQPVAAALGVKPDVPPPKKGPTDSGVVAGSDTSEGGDAHAPKESAQEKSAEEKRRLRQESMLPTGLLENLRAARIAPPATQPEAPVKLSQVEKQQPNLAENLRQMGLDTQPIVPAQGPTDLTPQPDKSAAPRKDNASIRETALEIGAHELDTPALPDFRPKPDPTGQRKQDLASAQLIVRSGTPMRTSVARSHWRSRAEVEQFMEDYITAASEDPATKPLAEEALRDRDRILQELTNAEEEVLAGRLKLAEGEQHAADIAAMLRVQTPEVLKPGIAAAQAVGLPAAKVTDSLLDFVPYVGVVKLTLEAATGMTLSGQIEKAIHDPSGVGTPDLDTLDRIIRILPLAIHGATQIVSRAPGWAESLATLRKGTNLSESALQKVISDTAKLAGREKEIAHALLVLRARKQAEVAERLEEFATAQGKPGLSTTTAKVESQRTIPVPEETETDLEFSKAGSGATQWRVGINVDERLAVGEPGISPQEAMRRALDLRDRQFIDLMTNQATKREGIEVPSPARVAPNLSPVSVADNPSALITRPSLGGIKEWDELSAIIMKKKQASLAGKNPEQVRNILNRAIREEIKNPRTTPGKAISDALVKLFPDVPRDQLFRAQRIFPEK